MGLVGPCTDGHARQSRFNRHWLQGSEMNEATAVLPEEVYLRGRSKSLFHLTTRGSLAPMVCVPVSVVGVAPAG